MRSDKILWTLAFAFYGVGDTVTTLFNLGAGMRELNPLINVYSILFLKIFVFAVAVFLYRKYRERLVPIVLTLVGAYGVFSNTFLNA